MGEIPKHLTLAFQHKTFTKTTFFYCARQCAKEGHKNERHNAAVRAANTRARCLQPHTAPPYALAASNSTPAAQCCANIQSRASPRRTHETVRAAANASKQGTPTTALPNRAPHRHCARSYHAHSLPPAREVRRNPRQLPPPARRSRTGSHTQSTCEQAMHRHPRQQRHTMTRHPLIVEPTLA